MSAASERSTSVMMLVEGHEDERKNTICLWYDKDAEDAARFYAATFPDCKVIAVDKAPPRGGVEHSSAIALLA